MRRLLDIVQGILKALGGYLLLVGVLSGSIFIMDSIYKVLGGRLRGALFQIFGSWLLVTVAHWAGRFYGNDAMRSRVVSGKMSGDMGPVERFWLEAKAVLGALAVVFLGAAVFDLTSFHLLVAAIVVPLPVLIGTHGEIKRWLQGTERLAATEPQPGPYYIVGELDRFPMVGADAAPLGREVPPPPLPGVALKIPPAHREHLSGPSGGQQDESPSGGDINPTRYH